MAAILNFQIFAKNRKTGIKAVFPHIKLFLVWISAVNIAFMYDHLVDRAF